MADKTLTPEQEASALYILQQLTPITDKAALDARMAEIHLEPGREAGPNCGCRECFETYGEGGARSTRATSSPAIGADQGKKKRPGQRQ
jgi:hypothetical protein